MCTPGSRTKVADTARTIIQLLNTKYQNHNTSEQDYFILTDNLAFPKRKKNCIQYLQSLLLFAVIYWS